MMRRCHPKQHAACCVLLDLGSFGICLSTAADPHTSRNADSIKFNRQCYAMTPTCRFKLLVKLTTISSGLCHHARTPTVSKAVYSSGMHNIFEDFRLQSNTYSYKHAFILVTVTA